MEIEENSLGYEDVRFHSHCHKKEKLTIGKRILFVVDVSNLYYCVKKNFNEYSKINYDSLLGVAVGDSDQWKAIAYGIQVGNSAERFKQRLEEIGFQVKFKEAKIITTQDRGQIRKGNLDIDIAVDIITHLDLFDILILGSADGDFAACLRHVKSKGKKIIVIGSKISYELKEIADICREITHGHLE